MPKKTLNPLRLAVLLHWDPEDTAPASTSPEAKRILDYWLQQIEHFDPVFAPEYVEAPALLSKLLIEEASHDGRQAKVREDSRFHHWGPASTCSRRLNGRWRAARCCRGS